MGRPALKVDPRLKEWATPRQAEYLDAVAAHGGVRPAARALKVQMSAISNALKSVRKKAALQGYSPEHDWVHPVPEMHVAKGVSTYYDKDGKPRGQWVKSRLDEERWREVVEAAVQQLAQEVKGLAPLMAPPARSMDELLAVYPMGDPHIGMYAWQKETGEAFDLEIARSLSLGAVDRLVASAPAAATAIILPLGDVFHADDQTNATPANKHQLDVDSRFVKVLGVGIEIYRHIVLRALEKHQSVVVRFVAGNHDPHSVWSLAFTIAAYFASEPRVQVDLDPAAHWFYRFGSVLIGATHGDKSKHSQLLGVMAADRPRDWGETKHRFFYTGHVHHSTVTELPGLVCEAFRTLAARDAYAAGHGYRAGRDMVCIVHHRDHGEIERHRVDIGMLETP